MFCFGLLEENIAVVTGGAIGMLFVHEFFHSLL